MPLPRGDSEVWLGVVVSLPGDALAADESGRLTLQILVEVRNDLGFPITWIHAGLVLDPGVDFIQKPFELNTLARDIRKALERAG